VVKKKKLKKSRREGGEKGRRNGGKSMSRVREQYAEIIREKSKNGGSLW